MYYFNSNEWVHKIFFGHGGKNMSFKIEDESVFLKYTEIWNKIKNSLNVKFHSQPFYDGKYIKTKVRTGNEIPTERNWCICIAAMCIDSVLRVVKKLSSSLLRAMQIQN